MRRAAWSHSECPRFFSWTSHGGKTKGSGIFSCNCARRILKRSFWFSCRVSRAAARNNSKNPRFRSLQRSELLRLDQGRAEKSLIFAQPSPRPSRMLKKSLFHPPDPGAPRRAFSHAAFSLHSETQRIKVGPSEIGSLEGFSVLQDPLQGRTAPRSAVRTSLTLP